MARPVCIFGHCTDTATHGFYCKTHSDYECNLLQRRGRLGDDQCGRMRDYKTYEPVLCPYCHRPCPPTDWYGKTKADWELILDTIAYP